MQAPVSWIAADPVKRRKPGSSMGRPCSAISPSATALLRGSCFEVPLFLRRDLWVLGVLRVGSTFQFFTSGLLGRNIKNLQIIHSSPQPSSASSICPARGCLQSIFAFFSAKDAGLLLVCRWLSTAALLRLRELFPQRPLL